MRVAYGGDDDLEESDLAGGWLALARAWLQQAIDARLPEPNAITLGTVDAQGRPATRTVLCKEISTDGVVFFTNYGSAKAQHLAATPFASATFPWIGIQRQLTVRGPVTRVSADETAAYWATRPRGSQLGAWASQQSSPIGSRQDLERQLADVTDRFENQDVPVPPNWGGLRIAPESVEFWQGRNNRLHNRLVVTASGVERLQP
ncbi:pyridoxamine 5'-phosphate oxidase [Rhodococcus sp. MEB064]|uniref:pyridoxamine 5'-phosphate oxidase n=1 Tax=Rhodococcus sp. MEB064 TaxID=1587522 RepID=UPI0005AC82DA|nr:pyridoxamine 5'-phosphate oxidase [Rhodococcus sp. MEB064]KIQ13801.1 pyridoxamine 5'-phosphate oxidase [Rhodococcus sp. MEB064]